MPEKLLFEFSTDGKRGVNLPDIDVPEKPLEEFIPREYHRTTPLQLPELSEPEIVRHFVNLSDMNEGLGSNPGENLCVMSHWDLSATMYGTTSGEITDSTVTGNVSIIYDIIKP